MRVLIFILSVFIGSGDVLALGEKSQEEGGAALKTGKGIALKTKTIKIGTLNDESGPAAVIGKPYPHGKRILAKDIKAG